MSNKSKVLFIHNAPMPYRLPFFKALSSIYDLRIIFTDIAICQDVYNIAFSDEIGGLEEVDYKVLEDSSSPLSLIKLINELFNCNCDLLVDSFLSFKSLIAFIIMKIRGIPIIFWSEEWEWRERKKLRIKLFSRFVDTIMANTDAFIVPGNRHRDYFISLGVSPDKIFVVPNVSNIAGGNLDWMNKEEIKRQLGVENKRIILYVGRLIKRKGVDYLIKSFAKLQMKHNDIVLLIIGQGECRNELENLAEKYDTKDNIYFLGYIEDKFLAAYYLLCNICIIPSITLGIGDPWVFVVNEAMYFGKPVIATNAVGSATDMIKNGKNGFMVPEKDVEALYVAMKEILSDPVLEKKMGLESRKIIDSEYVYRNMVDGFRKAVNYVLEN